MGNRVERNKNKKIKQRRRRIVLAGTTIIILTTSGYFLVNKLLEQKKPSINVEDEREEEPVVKEVKKTEIVISAAGDCTLGTDTKFDQSTSLPAAVKAGGNDYSLLLKNVNGIFGQDDYTIVNLENPFTESQTKADKGQGTVFHFKGPKEYVNILTEGSVEGVTISNNHIYDYGKQGMQDTIQALENKVDYFGEGYKVLKEIKGIKFGFLGYQGWNDTKELRSKIKSDIEELKNKGAKVVIPYFHWGIERESKPNTTQVNLARFSIDSGADMVLGSHPHVIQSMENYNGKMIVYSLANFSFGGNSNPSDKRTFIIQMKYKFEDDNLVDTQYKVIPTTISSVDYKNDYKPTLANENMKSRILKDLNSLSPTLNGEIKDEFWNIQ
ncbi:MAG: CapA family protein [Clostridium sp.]